jgi:hypothetical protein
VSAWVRVEDLRPDDFVQEDPHWGLDQGDEVVDQVQETPGAHVVVHWVGWSATRRYPQGTQFKVLNR